MDLLSIPFKELKIMKGIWEAFLNSPIFSLLYEQGMMGQRMKKVLPLSSSKCSKIHYLIRFIKLISISGLHQI